MATSLRASETRRIPSSEGSQTLVEYLKLIEQPPKPGPKPVNILDVLFSVYSETAAVTVGDAPGIEEVAGTKTEEILAVDDGMVNPLELRPASAAFKLARLAALISIAGWILLFVFFSPFSGLLFFCSETTALVLAVASFSYPNDCQEIRPLRTLALGLSVGWIPIILLFLLGWPAFIFFLIIGFVCFIGKKISASRREEHSDSVPSDDHRTADV